MILTAVILNGHCDTWCICSSSLSHKWLERVDTPPSAVVFLRLALTNSARRQRTYPEYFAVLIVAVLSGVVLPGNSELVLAHVAQACVLARLHLSYEPAGKLRLGRAGREKHGGSHKDFGATFEEHKQDSRREGTREESGRVQRRQTTIKPASFFDFLVCP